MVQVTNRQQPEQPTTTTPTRQNRPLLYVSSLNMYHYNLWYWNNGSGGFICSRTGNKTSLCTHCCAWKPGWWSQINALPKLERRGSVRRSESDSPAHTQKKTQYQTGTAPVTQQTGLYGTCGLVGGLTLLFSVCVEIDLRPRNYTTLIHFCNKRNWKIRGVPACVRKREVVEFLRFANARLVPYAPACFRACVLCSFWSL